MTKPASARDALPSRYLVYHFRAPPYSTRTWMGTKTPRWTGWCRFEVILSGSMEAEWDDQGQPQRLTAREGDVVFWNLCHWATNAAIPRQTICVVEVQWTPPPGLARVAHDERGLIRLLAGELLTVYLQDLPDPLKHRLLDGYFHALLAEYLRLTAAHPSSLVDELRRFTEQHLAEPFRVGELARHFGLSERQFQHRYRAAAGHTPMAEVRWLRAERARINVINLPELPLKEVARRVGLRDHHELNRLFKRCYGLRARDLLRTARALPNNRRAHAGPNASELPIVLTGRFRETKPKHS